MGERFEAEKDRLRREIDGLNGRLARQQMDVDKANAYRLEAEPKLKDLQGQVKTLSARLMTAESLSDSSFAKQKQLEAQNKKLQSELENALNEIEDLKKQVADLQRQVEDEHLMRQTAQQKVKSLEEDLAFLKSQHDAEMEEVSRKREIDMTTYAKQISEDYAHKLQDQLAEMRAHFQVQRNNLAEQFEDNYKTKMSEVQERADRAMSESFSLRARLREVDGLQSVVDRLKSDLENQKREFEDRLGHKDMEISNLNKEIQRLMEKCANLLDIKVQLDAELETYRMLLESEETRLNLSAGQSPRAARHHVSFHSQSTSGSQSAGRGVKRRRYEVNGESDVEFHRHKARINKETHGPIEIAEVAENSDWVRIENTSDEEVSIAQWKIKLIAGDKETTYSFNNRMKLGPHSTVTVYSMDATDGKHQPPEHYVMKRNNWPVGENPSATLESDNGDVMSSITVAESDSSNAEDPAERCSIMEGRREMTCFVTVGTTLFEELSNEVLSEESISALQQVGIKKLILQIGAANLTEEVRNRVFGGAETEDKGRGSWGDMQISYYRYKNSIADDIRTAKIVIGHCGAGTCLDVLRAKKPFIVVVNERLMDNHQMELATAMADENHLLFCTPSKLAETIRDNRLFELTPFHPPR
ncbi:hypothetical protein WR25_11930 isoform C [Diploscapter pachys]|nr:hypothetical protein WR25_11930 isoform C [Diploscapter pachys]